jgi:beta-barrel assembly-enhancing protease
MYKVDYFDGKTSRAQPATVSISGESLYISVSDSHSRITWDLNKVHKSEFQNKGKTLIKYGQFPFQYIELDAESRLLIDIRAYKHEQNWFEKIKYKYIHSDYRAVLISITGLIAFLVLSYLFVVPWIAMKSVNMVSIQSEVNLGNKFYDSFLNSGTTEFGKDSIVVDTVASKYVMEIFHSLKYKTPYPMQITVVKDDVMNAFAMPGGHIVIYDAMIKKMDDPSQLIALIGHEGTHVNERHTLKALSRNLANYLLLSVIMGDATAISGIFADNASQLGQLSFSRELESQSDDKSIEMMRENKIDINGMVDLMEILEKEAGNLEIPEFMSSHPLTKERVKNAKLQALKYSGFEKKPELDALFAKLKASL